MTTEIVRNFFGSNLLESEQLQSDRWYVDEHDDILYAVKDEDGCISLIYLADDKNPSYMLQPEDVSYLRFRELKATIVFSYL